MTGLTAVLHRAGWPEPRFTAADLDGWPAAEREAAARLGLLAAAPPAAAVRCPGCDLDHVEPVQVMDVPDRPRRWFVRCPEAGRVWVGPDDLRRWAINPPALANRTAEALATGPAAERVGGRVWKLGPVRLGGRAWVAWLAVGLDRSDGAAVAASVPELRLANAIVFVPTATPPVTIWGGGPMPTVVPLCDVLSLTPSGLVADRAAVAAAIGLTRSAPAAEPTAVRLPPGTTWETVTVEVDDHALTVRAGDTSARVGFAEAGFEDRRKRGVPNAGWRLLTLLARRRGTLDPADAGRTKGGGLKTGVSALRSALRALTGLADDPFHPTRPGKPYRTRFRIRHAAATVVPVPPDAGWADVTVSAVGSDRLRVAVGDSPAGVYTRAELGLADADGRSTPAGRALARVLDAGGRVRGKADDRDLLALSGALSKAVPAAGRPFEYDRTADRWTAVFAVG